MTGMCGWARRVAIMAATTMGVLGGPSAHVAWGADQPKLVAPVYSGATTLECKVQDTESACAFGTKDTLAQVKAFYDKSVGPLHEIKNGYVAPVRAGKAVVGEGTTATVFATVTLRSKPAVTLPPASDPNFQRAAQQLKYVGVLGGQVGWPAGGKPLPPQELKAHGLRSPDEFYAVFQKYQQLESAYYPKDQAEDARARYESKIKDLQMKYMQKGAQLQQDNAAAMDQMRKDQAQRQQSMQDQCKQGPTAQQKADYEEIARIIKKNSAERYSRFTAAREKVDKDGCPTPGQAMDLSSPRMQHAMELGNIISEDKEAMAYAEKISKRDEASRPKSAGAEAFSRTSQANVQMLPDLMNANWQAGLDYLAALDKIALRTRIAIDGEKFGADGGEVTTDRKKVEELWAKMNAAQQQDVAGGDEAMPSRSAKAAQPDNAGAKQAPAKKTPSTDDAADAAKKAGKEGLNMLKKLF